LPIDNIVHLLLDSLGVDMDRCLFCDGKFRKRQGKGYNKVNLNRKLRFVGDDEVHLTAYDALQLLYSYEVLTEFVACGENFLCYWIQQYSSNIANCQLEN